MSELHVTRESLRKFLELPNCALLKILRTFSIIDLAKLYKTSARLCAIVECIMKDYNYIDVSEFCLSHPTDRWRIFETFGHLFEGITIQYPDNGLLYLKLIREYCRKTIRYLNCLKIYLSRISNEWTESFDKLEELKIVDCEASPEHITKLLSLCPKLKIFQIVWTIFTMTKVSRRDYNSFIDHYRYDVVGGSAAEKFSTFLIENKELTSFHLCITRADLNNLRIRLYKFIWSASNNKT